MASEQSYSITLSNNRTEKAAVDFLLACDSRFWVPQPASRKQILAVLGLDARYSRAFDLVLSAEGADGASEFKLDDPATITLIELKTTRKCLPDIPRGFFFGATQNEFELAEALGDQFKFCFVCLHPDHEAFRLTTLKELEPLIRTKRVQYQINL